LKHISAGVAGVVSGPVLVLSKKVLPMRAVVSCARRSSNIVCLQNKRPVKSDTEEAESKAVAKLKKPKNVNSPNGKVRGADSPSSSTFNTPTNRPRVHAESPPEFEGVGDPMGEDDQWGAEIVRFRNPSQGLCLWANAAFNFMHRLQWQNRLEASHDGDALKYQCPACRATYGSRPHHRTDCDLALLLEQTGSYMEVWFYTLDSDAYECVVDAGSFDDSHETPVKRNKTSPEKAVNGNQENGSHTSGMRPSIGQPSFNGAAVNLRNDATLPSAGFGSASGDLMTKNLNLGSWEGYSSLSKIMFRYASPS
jgi:hypothetical protein